MLPAKYVTNFLKKLHNHSKYLQVTNNKNKAYRLEIYSLRPLLKTFENKNLRGDLLTNVVPWNIFRHTQRWVFRTTTRIAHLKPCQTSMITFLAKITFSKITINYFRVDKFHITYKVDDATLECTDVRDRLLLVLKVLCYRYYATFNFWKTTFARIVLNRF